jgi:hypothetical protein
MYVVAKEAERILASRVVLDLHASYMLGVWRDIPLEVPRRNHYILLPFTFNRSGTIL